MRPFPPPAPDKGHNQLLQVETWGDRLVRIWFKGNWVTSRGGGTEKNSSLAFAFLSRA